MSEFVIDLSKPEKKRRLLTKLGALSGVYRIKVVRYRRRRSDRQNAWYWPCIIGSLHTFLREQGEAYTAEDCHEMLKWKFLRKSIIDRSTGEVIGERARSTTTLTTEEFSEYCELCRAWLADQFDIIVPDPNPCHGVADANPDAREAA